MHQIIKAILYANSEEEALDKDKAIFENLCGDGQAFDYYTLFNEDSPVSGKARWGNLPVIARADSLEGKQLIDEGMQATRDEFMENIAHVREGLNNLTDEELFREELGPGAIAAKAFDESNSKTDTFAYNAHMIKYFMRGAGAYTGPDVYLYGQYGEGIRTPESPNNVLNKWRCLYEDEGKENPYKDSDIFVVPADVHY